MLKGVGSPAQTPRAQREGGAVLQTPPEAGEKDGTMARMQDSHSAAFTPEILLWRSEKEKKKTKTRTKPLSKVCCSVVLTES